ncbi:hypothetical protein [Yinghuangia seranimata]|uniref:hypothetical protein n=1 Tax=Yinghuangia seranimata TaxID=408067 RepID=UPI00248CCA11|nr:hypothetical protein [Yinghuangia seranimata]MDI2127633.1 hypothetical protein [Yinghuangia seranimata]
MADFHTHDLTGVGKRIVTVDAQPGDRIRVGFVMADAGRELLNGNLIIHTPEGGAIRLPGYSAMRRVAVPPVILDASNHRWTPAALLDDLA